MFSNFDILINYPEALRQAERLRKVSNWCEDMNRSIGKEVQRVENCWYGKAGDSMKNKLNQLKTQNQRVANDLSVVAKKIENAVDEIKAMDAMSEIRIRKIDE